MKNKSSRKLLYTTIAIVALTFLSGLSINLLTGNEDFNKWLKENNIGAKHLVFGTIAIGFALIVLAYFQYKYTEKSEEEKEILAEDIEPDVKKFFDILKHGIDEEDSVFQRIGRFIFRTKKNSEVKKGRYQKRYNSKLDGRFDITLEVSGDFDAPNPHSITEQFGENATKGEAIEVIRKEFNDKGRLLIAGNAGVGKTVLLLKLAIGLLDKIENPEKEPFPVIFNLASWSEDYKDFGEWLKAMLVSGYGLSKDFAEKIIDNKRIILLLDGLDELARNETNKKIAAERRAKCLASANNYLNNGCKGVICSRIDEFLLMKKLEKQDAPVEKKVRVLNLSPEKVKKALENARDDKDFKHRTSSKHLLGLIEKEENKNLLEVLRTPFYFTTAMVVFDKTLLDTNNFPNDKEEIEKYLNERFVEIKISNMQNLKEFEDDTRKIIKWVQWLAVLMETQQLVVFELADLQPIHLKNKWKFGLLFGAIGGLILGLFITSVFFLFDSWIFDSYHNFVGDWFNRIGSSFLFIISGVLSGSLVGSLYFILLDVSLFGINKKLEKANNFSKVYTEDIIKLRFSKKLIITSLLISLCLVFLDRCIVGNVNSSFFILVVVLGFVYNLQKIKEIYAVTHIQKPYQRIFGGISINLLIMFALSILIIFLPILLNSFETIGYNNSISKLGDIYLLLIFPICIFLDTSLFRHFLIRLSLYVESSIPLKYATFLYYATEARILENDGGQWRFRHQNLQEYFANLEI